MYDNKYISNERITEVRNATYHVGLWKIQDPNSSKKVHYAFIKDLSKLLSPQKDKHKHKMHMCNHCQRGLRTREALGAHLEKGCYAIEEQQISMPKKGEAINFKNLLQKAKITLCYVL